MKMSLDENFPHSLSAIFKLIRRHRVRQNFKMQQSQFPIVCVSNLNASILVKGQFGAS
jgi:hypothetical protein